MVSPRVRIPSSSQIDYCVERLSTALNESLVTNAFPRVFLGFPSLKEELVALNELKTEVDWPIGIALWTEGQIGETFRLGKITRWPSDSVPYKRVSDRTDRSICYPVYVGEEIIAALLFDFFQGEELVSARFHIEAARLARICGNILAAYHTRADELEREIKHLTEQCRLDCRATRAYSAIQLFGRPPMLIRTGKNPEKFQQIGFDEGLTGEVMRTGKEIILGNVWEHPSYLSSDTSIKSEAVFPLSFGLQRVGVLNLEAQAKRHFSKETVVVAREYAERISALVAELLDLYDFSDAGFSRALSYLTSSTLTTGMVATARTSTSYHEAVVESLRDSVAALGIVDWDVNIVLPVDFGGLGIHPPLGGNVVRLSEDGVRKTRAFVFSRGEVFCCVEVSWSSFLDEASVDKVLFLGAAAVSEVRRRESEGALIGFQNFVEASFYRDFSFEQICFSFLSELGFFMEADIVAGYALDQADRNFFSPLLAFDLREGVQNKRVVGSYSYDEAIELCSSRLTDFKNLVVAPHMNSNDISRIFEAAKESEKRILEAPRDKVAASLVIPFHRDGSLRGFLRFLTIKGGMERRFHFQSAKKGMKIMSLISHHQSLRF